MIMLKSFFPVVLRYMNGSSQISMSLISIPVVTEASANGWNIFNMLSTELEKFNLDWKNCLALGSDNAAVMAGRKEGVFGRIKEKHSNIYFAGCVCHLLHIAAKNATNSLPVDFDDVLIDMYYYLKNSAKRQTELKIAQELCGDDNLKVLKYVPTRWLSMKQSLCIDRLLALRKSLKSYFDHERKKSEQHNSRPARVYKFLCSQSSLCYTRFLSYILEMFVSLNVQLQSEKPLIHKLRRMLREFYLKLLTKFMKNVAFDGKDLLSVNVDYEKVSVPYEKTDEQLCIGDQVRQYINDQKMPRRQSCFHLC